MMDVQVDAGDVGFDADRLARIGDHFQGYVDRGLLPGFLVSVSRGGKRVYVDARGQRDCEAGLPVELDSIFRIYSMTKPITTVAAMMLYEEGRFKLKDAVADLIPSFADQQVFRSGSATNPTTEPVLSPMQIWHLMSHTSGLTYGFLHAHPVDAMYRTAGFEWGNPPGADLAACVDLWAQQPLLFQPGSEWNYSVATDVLGRVVEVVSGMSLDEFFRTRIFEPLGMTDTGFHVGEDRQDRLAALYVPNPGDDRRIMRMDAMGDAITSPPTCLSGGGGLASTAHDYDRFTRMLLNGGELDGVRLLGSRTVQFMASNHLPGNADLTAYGRPLFSETDFDGVGFGLGFSVVLDNAATKVLSSTGEFAWGGAASTAFWVDPAEEITALFLTQLLPSSAHPLRPELKQLVYQALVD